MMPSWTDGDVPAVAIPDRDSDPSSTGVQTDRPGNDDVAAGFAVDGDAKTDDASTCSSSLGGYFYAVPRQKLSTQHLKI